MKKRTRTWLELATNNSEIQKIVNEYKGELKKHNIRITKAILYGAYAKGNSKPYSDIDLVVISPDLARLAPLRKQELLSQWAMNIDVHLILVTVRKLWRRSFGRFLRNAVTL